MRQLQPVEPAADLTPAGHRPLPLEQFDQRGWVPTMAYWNQRGVALVGVRLAFMGWIAVVAACTALWPGPIPAGAGVVAATLWFFGLGAYERRLRRKRA